jgi:hypothetical protein
MWSIAQQYPTLTLTTLNANYIIFRNVENFKSCLEKEKNNFRNFKQTFLKISTFSESNE